MLRGVLFDFNGVLVDDEDLHLAGFNAVLGPLGVTISPEAYAREYLGFDDRGALEAALTDRGVLWTPSQIAALIRAKSVVYADLARTHLRVFPRAAELLREVASLYPVAVVSGALHSEITSALAVMGVEDCVQAIIAAEDVARCKPDPEGYHLGLKALGIALGRDAVAIEDSTAGIAAARSAGLSVMAVAHTYAISLLEEAGATAVRRTLGELSVRDLEALWMPAPA